MAYSTVLLAKQNHIATLKLNRPERLNAINGQMFSDLFQAIQDVRRDEDVRVLVLTGVGKAFCASADVKEETHGTDGLQGNRSTYAKLEFAQGLPQKITLALQELPKPTIAMVNGLAIGTGFDWVLACDIRIGSENAKFMNAFIQMGLAGATGGVWLSTKTIGINRALEYLYTGDWITADDAYRMGILNRLVPTEKLQEETMVVAARIAARAPIPQKLVKEMAYQGLSQTLRQHLVNAAAATALTMGTADHKEALASFNAKCTPNFKGK